MNINELVNLNDQLFIHLESLHEANRDDDDFHEKCKMAKSAATAADRTINKFEELLYG